MKSRKFFALELIRICAATSVLLEHLSHFAPHNPLAFFHGFGQIPVIAFFILSGFVIGLRHHNRSEPFLKFMWARVLRIWPIYLFVMVSAGLLLFVPSYNVQVAASEKSGFTLFTNLLLIQGPAIFGGNSFFPWAANNPVWSLSYEWWFYVLFGILHRQIGVDRTRWMVYAGGVIGVLGCMFTSLLPFTLFALLPIWWIGVDLAQQFASHQELKLSRSAIPLGFLALICGIKFIGIFFERRGMLPPDLNYKLIINFYFYALGFSVVACLFSRALFGEHLAKFKWIGVLGASSYALYLIHWPILALLKGLGISGNLLFIVVPLALAISIAMESVFHKKVVELLRNRVSSSSLLSPTAPPTG